MIQMCHEATTAAEKRYQIGQPKLLESENRTSFVLAGLLLSLLLEVVTGSRKQEQFIISFGTEE